MAKQFFDAPEEGYDELIKSIDSFKEEIENLNMNKHNCFVWNDLEITLNQRDEVIQVLKDMHDMFDRIVDLNNRIEEFNSKE